MKITTEDKILAAAGDILERHGPQGLTTRAVCAAAHVTAPTLYHHFGDKAGLLNALIGKGIGDFMTKKRMNHITDDAVADLRRGWDSWVEFALRKPTLFKLMIEAAAQQPEVAQETHAMMRAIVERMHAQKKLAKGVDVTAASLAVQAAANGVVALFQMGASPQAIQSTGRLLFDAVLARLTAR